MRPKQKFMQNCFTSKFVEKKKKFWLQLLFPTEYNLVLKYVSLSFQARVKNLSDVRFDVMGWRQSLLICHSKCFPCSKVPLRLLLMKQKIEFIGHRQNVANGNSTGKRFFECCQTAKNALIWKRLRWPCTYFISASTFGRREWVGLIDELQLKRISRFYFFSIVFKRMLEPSIWWDSNSGRSDHHLGPSNIFFI